MKRKKNANRRTPGFTEDEMKRAVLKVVNDCVPINRVARDNGLCKKTLKSYVDKYLSLSGRKKKLIRFKPNYEINQVFTNDLERLFEESLLAAHLAQQKITRDYIREAAFEFATNCNVHVPKTWNVRKKSGLDWMYGYLNRHPVIKNIVASYRRPRYNDLIRAHGGLVGGVPDDIANVRIEIETGDTAAAAATDPLSDEVAADSPDELDAMADEYFYSYLKVQTPGVDGEPSPDDGSCLSGISVKTPIDEFRENLTAAYNAIAIDSCVPSERVYNLGEIALVVENPSRGPLVGHETVVTACCVVNATGDALPPFFVFPRARFRPSMLRGLPAGVGGTARRGGHVDADAFLLLLEHFQELTKAGGRHKVALIMDDDEYHVTIGSLDFCAKHSIELVTLPPHYARQLQPIGRYVFRTLKAYFNHACQRFRTAHPNAVISMYDVVALFCQIWPVAFTGENVVDGFTKAGIYPLDDELFTSRDFLQTEPTHDRAESPITCDLDIKLQPAGVTDSESSDEDQNVVAAPAPGQSSATRIERPAYAAPREVAPPTDKSAIEEFFDQLVNAYGALHRHGGLASEKVYNLDELELAVRTPTGVVETQRLRVTVSCCVSAAGVALPPFFVYPRDHFHAAVLEGAGGGARGTATADGASNAAVFALVLRHFQQQAQASPDNRVLLLVDCEEHHLTLEAIVFCQQHGIELVTVPPHITEPFQPLEKVFAVFETYFRADCQRFADEGRCVTLNDLAALFAGAAERSFTADNIIAGFESTGLWPLNKELFARDTLCLSYTQAPEQRASVANDEIGGRTQPEEYLLTDSDDGSVSSGDDDDIVEFYSKLDASVDALTCRHRTAAAVDAHIFVLGEFVDSVNDVGISAYLFVNAAGQSLPPFLVYPRHSRGRPQLYSGTMAATATADGTFDQTTYLRSLQHFQQHVGAMIANQTLLLVEGAAAHLCDEAAAFYRDHGITSLTFPGRDATLFSPLQEPLLWPLRTRFDEECGRNGPDGLDELAAVFERAWDKTLVPGKIAATFRLFGFCAPKSLEGKPPPEVELEVARSSEAEVVDNYESFIIEEEIEVVMPPPPPEEEEESTVMPSPPLRFPCRKCDAGFESAEHLWIHERTHQQSVIAQLSRCRYCDRACSTFAERDRHEGTHMKGDWHCCAFCDKECASRAALVQHRRKHQKQTS